MTTLPDAPNTPGSPGAPGAPDDATLARMYETMALIAATDDALRSAISAGSATLAYYSPRGQEAVAAGFAAALRPDDYLVTTYRGLHDHIAKGVPLRRLLAEMLGRAEGTGKGKGGPMHVSWPDVGLMMTTGVVGSGLPIANGLAWAASRQGDGRVTVVSFGDGASNIGAFHEALNLAAVWGLPVVFLCQNNGYGEHTAFADHLRVEHVAQRAAAYGMPGVTVDGNDPEAVHDAVSAAAGRARAGEGPTLVEAVTYRLFGHVFGDRMTYVDPAELEEAWRSEPVARFRHTLIGRGVLTEAAADEVEARCRGHGGRDPGRGARAPRAWRGGAAHRRGGAAGDVADAVVGRAPGDEHAVGHHSRARRGPRLGRPGGAPRRGHLRQRGVRGDQGTGRQVRRRPGARHADLGAGHRGRGGGRGTGGTPSRGRDHVHGLSRHVPGPAGQPRRQASLHVGGPHPRPDGPAHRRGRRPAGRRAALADARGVAHPRPGAQGGGAEHTVGRAGPLASCIADDDPCVFIEQVLALSRKGTLDDRPVPLGVADTKRPGADATVVTYGRQVHEAVAVADAMASRGVEVEVLDLRSLVPLDLSAVLESVGRTRRAVVLHEAVVTGGFGAELAAGISESLFDTLAAPVLRVGAVGAPLPYAQNLERLALPGPERLLEALEWVLAYRT